MDLKEADNVGSVRHPWETARAAHFLRTAKEARLFSEPLAWLDVGSGDAYFASRVAAEAPAGTRVTCWDSQYDPARIANLEQRYPKLRFSQREPDEIFDVLLVMDVLEHVQRDDELLSRLVRDRLKAGGHAIMSVPAWMELFTSHDTFLEHFRRYSPRTASALLDGAGLTIQRRGGLFHTLLLPRAAKRLLEIVAPKAIQSSAGAPAWSAGRVVTRGVDAVLRADVGVSWLAARVGLDLPGLTWWALCKK